jgi:hypothetical protein
MRSFFYEKKYDLCLPIRDFISDEVAGLRRLVVGLLGVEYVLDVVGRSSSDVFSLAIAILYCSFISLLRIYDTGKLTFFNKPITQSLFASVKLPCVRV